MLWPALLRGHQRLHEYLSMSGLWYVGFYLFHVSLFLRLPVAQVDGLICFPYMCVCMGTHLRVCACVRVRVRVCSHRRASLVLCCCCCYTMRRSFRGALQPVCCVPGLVKVLCNLFLSPRLTTLRDMIIRMSRPFRLTRTVLMNMRTWCTGPLLIISAVLHCPATVSYGFVALPQIRVNGTILP